MHAAGVPVPALSLGGSDPSSSSPWAVGRLFPLAGPRLVDVPCSALSDFVFNVVVAMDVLLT